MSKTPKAMLPPLSKEQQRLVDFAVAERNRRVSSYHRKANEFCALIGIKPNEMCKNYDMQIWEAVASFMDGVYQMFERDEKAKLEKEADRQLLKMQEEAVGVIATKAVALCVWLLYEKYPFDEEWCTWFAEDVCEEMKRSDRSMTWYLQECKRLGINLPLEKSKAVTEPFFSGLEHTLDSEIDNPEVLHGNKT